MKTNRDKIRMIIKSMRGNGIFSGQVLSKYWPLRESVATHKQKQLNHWARK